MTARERIDYSWDEGRSRSQMPAGTVRPDRRTNGEIDGVVYRLRHDQRAKGRRLLRALYG